MREGIIERRPSGATHSFRLTPGAYSILEGVPKKSKMHPGRSAWVSNAIIYFGTSTSARVSAQMGNLIFPNMEVASPQELHEELLTMQSRVEFWVRRCDDFEAKLLIAGSSSWFGSIWGRLRRKFSPK